MGPPSKYKICIKKNHLNWFTIGEDIAGIPPIKKKIQLYGQWLADFLELQTQYVTCTYLIHLVQVSI